MSATRILSQAQAEAVYSAMCALKKVDASLSSINLKDENGFPVVIHAMSSGMWMILSPHNVSEWHDNESAFAAAYGLQDAKDREDFASWSRA